MTAPLPRPERVSISEAMLIAGRPKRTMQALAAEGKIPGAAKLGGRWTFDERRLRGWIQEQEGETCQRNLPPQRAATGAAKSYGRGSWSAALNDDGAYERAMQRLLQAGAKTKRSA